VKSLGEVVQKIVSLPEGGLVLYGGLLLAPVGYWLFCRRRGLAALPLADLLIPSVLIGLMFGRLGCLMHGCCYGDFSELPWAIEFPRDSAPYLTQVFRGFLPDDMSAPRSLPLHPTQIYDALNALAIALLCWLVYPYRRRDGEITAMAALLYPINRIAIEFLRWDEAGQFGTRFTISQWVSAGLIAVATLALLRLSRLPPLLRPLVTPGYSSPT
jgi:phosphatidylglycerol:prolipoprotein diacylglycerol transferase